MVIMAMVYLVVTLLFIRFWAICSEICSVLMLAVGLLTFNATQNKFILYI